MNISNINIPAWEGFVAGQWQKDIDTAVFVRLNYTPYEEGPEFLVDSTPATDALWGKLQALQKEERAKGGVLENAYQEDETEADITMEDVIINVEQQAAEYERRKRQRLFKGGNRRYRNAPCRGLVHQQRGKA